MPTFYSGYQGGFRARTDVTLMSQNVANNTSTVRIIGYIEAQSGWWFGSASITAAVWCNAANLFTGTENRDVASGGVVAVVDYTTTITHIGDGTKTANIAVNVVANNRITFNQWAGGDYPLPTIARATTPNWAGNFEAGVAKTINLPRASAGFTHDVTYAFGAVTGSIAAGAGASTSWTPDLALLSQIPNTSSGTGTITTVTKSGGTVIGTKWVNFTLDTPLTVAPTVSAVLWDDENTTVKANIGAFVQGVSRVKGAVTAAGIYGSTIATKRLIVGGAQVPESAAFTVEASGTIEASGEAVDSRGRVGTRSANFGVLAYAPPAATAFQVRRANAAGAVLDGGTYLRLDLTAAVQSLLVGATQKNAMTIVAKTRLTGGAWTTRNTITPGLTYNTNVLIGGGGVYLANTSYEVRVEITDKAGMGYVAETGVSTGAVTLHFKGTSVGVGKFWERGGLDVANEIYSRGGNVSPIGMMVEFAGATAPMGWLLCDGTAVSRTTYAALFATIGETYGPGNGTSTFNLPDRRGRVGVGKSADTEFVTLGKTGGTKTHTLTTPELPEFWGSSGGSHVVPQGTFYGLTAAAKVGGGQPHNNLQPYITLNYLIRT